MIPYIKRVMNLQRTVNHHIYPSLPWLVMARHGPTGFPVKSPELLEWTWLEQCRVLPGNVKGTMWKSVVYYAENLPTNGWCFTSMLLVYRCLQEGNHFTVALEGKQT